MTNIRRLKWIAVLAPILFVAMLEYAWWAFGDVLHTWQGRLLADGVVLLAAFFLYAALFGVISDMQTALERKNQELLGLRTAGMAIASELSLEAVLQKVVDEARVLAGARYGALSVIDADGQILTFVTAGIDDETRRAIGPPPTGHGLLGVVLREGQRLRLDDLQGDPRSEGFPAHHPPMHTLLAVPVIGRGDFRGNLYVAEKEDRTPFTEEEEETLARFATQAAIAIDNAWLHRRVRWLAVAEERLRLAHEMHDGQAQVLAYVNTKSQAVRELLRGGRVDDAAAQLDQLAAAAREVYDDVREGILGLRTAAESDAGLVAAVTSHLERWCEQTGLGVETDTEPVPALAPDVELQLVRIVQESLSNVRKHAEATQVRVTVAPAEDGGLTLRIADDGRGFDPDAHRHGRPRFGLATMRERAESIGGRFVVEAARGRGTTVSVHLPPSAMTPPPLVGPHWGLDSAVGT